MQCYYIYRFSKAWTNLVWLNIEIGTLYNNSQNKQTTKIQITVYSVHAPVFSCLITILLQLTTIDTVRDYIPSKKIIFNTCLKISNTHTLCID